MKKSGSLDWRPVTLLRFGAVGLAAFGLSALILFALMRSGLSPFVAQVPAILGGLLTTYVLNRTFTFRPRAEASLAEFARYVAASAAGAVANYLAFVGILALAFPPLLALVGGTAAGMVTNFLGYQVYVFARK